jgi:hypothetical protein
MCWEYYEEEMNLYYKMLDAAKNGDDKIAFGLATQLKIMGLPNQKVKDWMDHILINYADVIL